MAAVTIDENLLLSIARSFYSTRLHLLTLTEVVRQNIKPDEDGLLTGVNLIVATVNNSAAISMSIEKAARGLIKEGQVSEGLLNQVEMAFRAYDPCLACATHSLPGETPLVVRVLDSAGKVIKTLSR